MTTFGTIEFSGKDIATPPLKYDRIAVGDRGELLLLSLVANQGHIKQVRAILAGGAKVMAMASGGKVSRTSDASWQTPSNPGRLYPTVEGYGLHTHKLGMDSVHGLFLTRMPGFLKVVTQNSLWRELNDTRFTTPLLREWMDFICAELIARDNLAEARAFNAQVAVLAATSADLDAIVTDGLRSGKLTITTNQEQIA